METPSVPTPGHGSLPPRAGTQPATVRFGKTSTMPTPGRGSPPPQAEMQPGNDRFVETSPGDGKQRVTARVVEIPTLPALGLDRPSWRTEAPWGTDVRGSPVWAGPVASAPMKGTKLKGNLKRGWPFLRNSRATCTCWRWLRRFSRIRARLLSASLTATYKTP